MFYFVTKSVLLLQMASANDARYGQKESADQNFDYMFKILIIGNSSVGKTSFLFRYADDSFTPAFVSTVGIDFKVKTIYRNDKRIKLQIWVRNLLCFISAEVLKRVCSRAQRRNVSYSVCIPLFLSFFSGHSWSGAVQDHHNSILPWSHGLYSYVWHHQWGFL